MGLLPDDVDFDSPWSNASDDLPKLKKRIAQLEAELSTVKEGRKIYKETADEAIAERDALQAENERLERLVSKGKLRAYHEGMERAAEIAECHERGVGTYDTDVADAIRAEIT